MADVQVGASGPHQFQVDVAARGSTMAHRVSVPPGFAAELGLGDVDEARLVEESFAFLLEREPAGAIMREFSLPTIGRYFPEYGDEMRRRLG